MKHISERCIYERIMVKVMSFYCGRRTRHVYGWVFLWFTSAVNISVSEGIELQVDDEVLVMCGDDVTLSCEATPSDMDIRYFAWESAKNITCRYGSQKTDSRFRCVSTEMPSSLELSLTLFNVMPADQGEYYCKLLSNKGMKSARTNLMTFCRKSANGSIDESHAKCWFSGVYPSGTIHWSQGQMNLTDSAITQQKDQNGRYYISSTIDVQKGNLSLPYECFLWMPSLNLNYPGPKLYLTKPQVKSGSSTVKLQLIFIMVEIMMVKCMT